MALLLAPSAAKAAAGQDEGKVAKVRVGGERGFVVFHAPGARLFSLAMVREGGEWKAGGAVGSVLAPAG